MKLLISENKGEVRPGHPEVVYTIAHCSMDSGSEEEQNMMIQFGIEDIGRLKQIVNQIHDDFEERFGGDDF